MNDSTIPTKKLSNGFTIPVYGYGMGGIHAVTPEEDRAEIELLVSLINAGVRHFDVAELYGHGHAEELLGRAIAGFDRNALFITTKIVTQNMAYEDVFRAVKSSLARLKTNYIDLYMLHRFPDEGVAIQDTMRALDELVDQGLIKYIGVSNFSKRRLDQAFKYTRHGIVCNQVHYNVKVREAEHREVLQYCQDNDIILTAWGPLHGVDLEDSLLVRMAVAYGKTPSQIALNWLVSQKNVVAICRTDTKAHLYNNLGAMGWKLSRYDIELIRKNLPNQLQVSDRVTLAHPGSFPD